MLKPGDVDPVTLLSEEQRTQFKKYEDALDNELRAKGKASVQYVGATTVMPVEVSTLAYQYKTAGWVVEWNAGKRTLYVTHPALVRTA
jgi:hypothetical protein